eukprot:12401424-Karenia_brevis.AAC.1
MSCSSQDDGHTSNSLNDIPSILKLSDDFKFLCHRQCSVSWRVYDVSSPSEKATDMKWALQRPGVQQRLAHRRATIAAGRVPKHNDPIGSALAHLTTNERQRYTVYQKKVPRCICDLNQNPLKVAFNSKGPIMHCITRSQGIQMHDGGMWLTPPDLFTAMGMPVVPETQHACGVECQFSRDVKPPKTRSRRSMSNQIGNAMH